MKQYYYSHDGNEQKGPATPDALARVPIAADTLVWADGMADWIRADQVPELAGLFGAPGAGGGYGQSQSQSQYTSQAQRPDAPPSYTPEGEAGGPMMDYSGTYDASGGYGQPQSTNGMAIASLVLGIVGIVTLCWFIPAILAIVFGHLANGQIRQGRGQGAGLAKAGLIMGYISIGLSVVGWVMYVLFIVAIVSSAPKTVTFPAPTPYPSTTRPRPTLPTTPNGRPGRVSIPMPTVPGPTDPAPTDDEPAGPGAFLPMPGRVAFC